MLFTSRGEAYSEHNWTSTSWQYCGIGYIETVTMITEQLSNSLIM